MYGRPLGKRKRIQITIGLVILAWATQLLLHQWGYGAEAEPTPAVLADAPAPAPARAPAAVPAERFIAARPSVAGGATIELRPEATVFGPEVRLKQICRWSNHDAAVFLPIADLVVLRFDGRAPFKSIGLDELKTTLADAKANIANINFAGPLTCTVRRSEAEVDARDALQQWLDSRQAAATAGAAPTSQPSFATAVHPLPTAPPADATPAPALAAGHQPGATVPQAPREDASPLRTLRQLLTEDIGVRLNVPVEQLQINFNPKDERVLNLAEPQFRFNLEASRVRNLGEVEWTVTVVHDTGVKKVPIIATARAWQSQVLIARPLSARQIIRPEDLTERRTLADRLPDEPLLASAQIVGQQAGRDLKPGTVVTARMVDAVPLARPGQYVTISVNQGGIRIKTAARAMESGSFGQTIRVKNEATNETFEVVLTGPQQGTIGGAPAPAEPPKVAAAR